MYLGLHEGFKAIQSSKENIEPNLFSFFVCLAFLVQDPDPKRWLNKERKFMCCSLSLIRLSLILIKILWMRSSRLSGWDLAELVDEIWPTLWMRSSRVCAWDLAECGWDLAEFVDDEI